MQANLREIQSAVRALLTAEEETPTGVPGLSVWRFTGEKIRMPQTEEPYLYIVLDGALRLHTPSGMMDYMPGQYFISRIDTPTSGTVLAFSRHGDFLAASVAFTVNEVITAALGLDDGRMEAVTAGTVSGQVAAAADAAVVQSVGRLISAPASPLWSEFLHRNIMQEVIYGLLCGSCGKRLLQSVAGGQAEEIYEANSWIKENFRRPFTVEELAQRRHMSVSQFHQKFKSAVGMGPLQCQKRLRLTEARRLMLDEGRNVTEAAVEVGYESLSQFIRDYRKTFGAAPKEDIRNMQGRLEK